MLLAFVTSVTATAFAQTNEYTISNPPPEVILNEQSEADKIKNFIIEKAIENGIDPELATFIARAESEFNPNAIGDTHLTCLLKGSKYYGKVMRSRGIFQINDCWNDKISDEVAFSVASSTEWAMKYLKEKPSIWATFKRYKK